MNISSCTLRGWAYHEVVPWEAIEAPYALVVVREGYNANLLVYPALTDDLYNPTMDVLISGVLTDGSFEDHKWNKIGRKLKTGDRLCLIVYNTSGGTATDVAFELSFSFMT